MSLFNRGAWDGSLQGNHREHEMTEYLYAKFSVNFTYVSFHKAFVLAISCYRYSFQITSISEGSVEHLL